MSHPYKKHYRHDKDRRRTSDSDKNDSRNDNRHRDNRDNRDNRDSRDNRDNRDRNNDRYQGTDARIQITKNTINSNNSNNKKDDKPEGPLDTELFIGLGPYIRTEHQIVDCRTQCLQKPNSMYFFEVASSNFPNKKLPDNMKCRSLLIDFDVDWYKDLFDESGKIIDPKKSKDATTKITADIAVAVSFYKPARTFLQIFDPADDRDSDFGASLAWICYKEGWILIDFNSVGRSKISDASEEDKLKIWRGRIKWALKEYKPKDRELTSPTKGINCNEIVKR